MELMGVTIERYEDEYVPELTSEAEGEPSPVLKKLLKELVDSERIGDATLRLRVGATGAVGWPRH
jgi:hypothetical protein